MKPAARLILSTSPPAQTGGKPPGLQALRCRKRLPCRGLRYRPVVKELDAETGLYYYGARYLDPKTSRWLSGDPAMGEYIPSAPVNEEARKRNGNLPGMGGVFNHVNLHVYHYAGNNPVILIDLDGEETSARQLLGLLREFAEIFSIDIKVGIGFDVSAISSVKIDLFSMQGTFSLKNGYTEKFTTGVGAWIVGISRSAPIIENLSGIESLARFGETEINIGPVTFNEETGTDVVFSIGAQAIIGIRINISGRETVEFISKIGELQNALRE